MKIDNVLHSMLNELQGNLKENVLDFPRNRLNPAVFSSDNIMRPKVKEEIVNRFNQWKEKNWPDLKIKNWYLLGSITTYQYDSSSDIDVNIITSESKEDISKIWKQLPNGNTYKKHPINYYLSYNTDDVDRSKTLYDIEKDKWIKKPIKSNITIPTKYSMEIAKFFMDAIDLRLSELDRDKRELARLKEVFDSKDSYMEEDEIKEEIDKVKMEIKADVDSIRLAHYIVKGFRKEGFIDDNNKFQFSINVMTDDDSNKSMNNLIYKELERFGYFDKMDKAENETN